jgi:hypothetical protein
MRKQRVQAVIESLHEITTHLDALNAIAFDLGELGIPSEGLTAAIDTIDAWRSKVQVDYPPLGARRLAEPKPAIERDVPEYPTADETYDVKGGDRR